VDGLAFLGLSLSQKDDRGHPDSLTHQTAFDLNEVQDRDYKYMQATNDDGWLAGGGEPGPPRSYKLAAKDSSHVEMMRIGTYKPEWGGVTQEEIVRVMKSGVIFLPQIEVLPTVVKANPDKPPELEVKFDMEDYEQFFKDPYNSPLPINWSLRFVHNQLFRRFQFPSRFCPGPFHSTILRKAGFRSEEHKEQYFQKCAEVLAKWKKAGPQPLHATDPPVAGQAAPDVTKENRSGIYLFTDRNNITHHFEPNFLPPYDTPEKREVILSFLKEEWDEKTRSWVPFPRIPSSVESSNSDEENKEPSGVVEGKQVEKAITSDPAAPSACLKEVQ